MSKRMDIEELVRGKLEQAEITPSPDAWAGVQRRLRMQRFLRFDPGKFNLYYLGGLAAAGVAAFFLITGLLAPEEIHPVPIETARQTVESSPQENETIAEKEGLIASEKQMKGSAKKDGVERGKETENTSALQDPTHQYMGEEDVQQPAGDLNQEGERRVEDQAVQKTLVSYFTVSTLSGCAPLQVRFTNTSINAISSSWSFGTGESTTESNPIHTFTEPGKYTVTLQATGEEGISKLYSQVVEVFPEPDAEFEIAQGLEGINGVESLELINYSSGAFSFKWDLPGQKGVKWSSTEFQPSLKAEDHPGNARLVRLMATNNQGCTDTCFMEIPASEGVRARELKFPTAFNANHTGPTGGSYNPNDMRIDVFHPNFTEVPGVYHLQIFSRMGELVFESQDIYTGWDGYVREERAAGGVYLWVVEGTWENGSAFSQKGDLTLLWSDRRWP